MFKSSKFFRIILIGIALVIFNQCELKAQQAWIYSSTLNDEAAMSWNDPQFNYVGYLGGGVSFYMYDVPNLGELEGSFSFPSGNIYESTEPIGTPFGFYEVTLNTATGDYFFESSNNCLNPADVVELVIQDNSTSSEPCSERSINSAMLFNGINSYNYLPGFDYQWYVNGTPVPGGSDVNLDLAPLAYSEPRVIQFAATCPVNNESFYSNEIVIPACYDDFSSPLNYLLVQNVTTTGNIPGQSIQVQFDLNWGNSWRDDINWDAVWVFMKYKDANGVWKHAKVSPTGYSNGQGTPNLIEPAADQMGAFVRLALEGQGNFDAEGMQLRWNYGADGLASVSGLEVRVFATEMVYHPQGDFSIASGAPGGKSPVINGRLSPVLSIDDDSSIRIKGDAGLDRDADGVIDNSIYPTGYYPFYMFKYEMSEQQYADFLNCLTIGQQNSIGVAGTFITQSGIQYFSARPNAACVGADDTRMLAYADWSGLRPMSFLEFSKAYNGARTPRYNCYDTYILGACSNFGSSPVPDVSTHYSWGAGVYGCKSLSGILHEPYVRLSSSTFNRTIHGNGVLSSLGLHDEASWNGLPLIWHDYLNCHNNSFCSYGAGFRLCRTAE